MPGQQITDIHDREPPSVQIVIVQKIIGSFGDPDARDGPVPCFPEDERRNIPGATV